MIGEEGERKGMESGTVVGWVGWVGKGERRVGWMGDLAGEGGLVEITFAGKFDKGRGLAGKL